MLNFLKVMQVAWGIVLIGFIAILGFCVVVASADAREEVYNAWANLAAALIPAVPSIIAPWLLGLFVCGVAFAPFMIIEEIKKRY